MYILQKRKWKKKLKATLGLAPRFPESESDVITPTQCGRIVSCVKLTAPDTTFCSIFETVTI